MAKTPKIEQIYYGDWNDKLAPGHEDYWSKVSAIAKVLAAQLEFSIHGYRAEPYFYSTIAVRDYKEKFGEIRMYCSLAEPYLVKRKYEDYLNGINSTNLAYRTYKTLQDGEEVPDWKKRMYEKNPNDFPVKAKSLKEFSKERYYEDACYYRQVYLDTVDLFPEYKDVICNAADWDEFLYTDPDKLDKYFQNEIDYYNNQEIDKKDCFINQTKKQWKLAKKVCFPRDDTKGDHSTTSEDSLVRDLKKEKIDWSEGFFDQLEENGVMDLIFNVDKICDIVEEECFAETFDYDRTRLKERIENFLNLTSLMKK